MSTAFNPSRDGHALDKLRHNDPKIGRMLNGVGSRAKQFAKLQEKGIMTVTTATSGPHTENAVRSAEYKQRNQITTLNITRDLLNRFIALRGKMVTRDFFAVVLDAYERAQQPSAAGLTAEAANLLGAFQQKQSLPSQLEAMRRLVESHGSAQARAKALREAEQETARLAEENRLLKEKAGEHPTNGEVGQLRARLAEVSQQLQAAKQAHAVQTHPVATSEVQDIALDFTEAFAGATMTADPSGEVVVTLAPSQLAKMFPIWMRAVTALGIAKREGA